MIGTRVRRASDVVGTSSRRRARWLWPLLAAWLVVLAHASNAAAQVSYDVVADLGTIGGAEPLGGLIAGSDGALYGTASRGGAVNCGLVYRIDASGTVAALHVFDGSDGCQPMGELIVGPDGGFYGVTLSGGDADPMRAGGTIYRLGLDGTHTVLHRFRPPSASDPAPSRVPFGPAAALLLHPDGYFYGTTRSADIFRIAPDGSMFQIIEGFGPPGEPDTLDSPLVLHPDGYLYGASPTVLTTFVQQSIVFRVTLEGATTIYQFRGSRPPPGSQIPFATAGIMPQGLAIGSDGAFYGVTSLGGPTYPGGDQGTIFRLLPDGTLTTLYTLAPGVDGTYPHGRTPRSNLVRGSDGYFYGTTTAGGASNNGTIFRVSESGAFTSLRSFATDGYAPVKSPLLEVTPGTFYGTASSASGGVVYRMRVGDGLFAENRLLSAEEGTPISGQLTAAGAGSAPLTFALVADGTRGEATISPTGAFTYTARLNGGLTGSDTFTFVVSDGVRTSNVGAISVLVSAVNDPPVAFDMSLTATPGVPVSGTLRATDPEGTPLGYGLVSQPTQGVVVVVNLVSGEFTYTATPAAAGQDAFTFRVGELGGQSASSLSNVATVTITIAAAPLTVSLTRPTGGEKFFVHTPVPIAWTATGATSVDVELSRDGGQSFAPIAECSALPGSASGCEWVPQGPATREARIRVVARNAGAAVSAESADFTIARGRPRLAIVWPLWGAHVGHLQPIWWAHNLGAGSSVRIELSRDDGATWEVIAPSVQNLTDVVGRFEWVATGPATKDGRLRVTSLSTGVSDVSGRLVIVDWRDW